MAQDRAIAAITCCAEASSASPQERRYVVWTFFNRRVVNPIRYGSTVAEVCLSRFQYSEWNGDARNNANLRRVARLPDQDATFLDCLAAYDEVEGVVENGDADDPTDGATSYWDHSIPAPAWASAATVTLKTDKFTFVKDVP